MREAPFMLGQRVRVCRYTVAWIEDPHFIVGHFGHIEEMDRQFFDVRISHGPNGGPIDQRVSDDSLVWPMLAEELEPVD